MGVFGPPLKEYMPTNLKNYSKRQILEALVHEQNQGAATLSRLITAVARTAGLNPVELAKNFIDEEGGRNFVEQFNESSRLQFAERQEAQEKELKEKEDKLKPQKDEPNEPTNESGEVKEESAE